MCRTTIAHSIRHCISSASLFKRLAIEPFDTYQPSTSSMDRPRRQNAINPSPKKNIDLSGRRSSTSRVLSNELEPNSQAPLGNDLPTEFAE
jgi:hypothetical protein